MNLQKKQLIGGILSDKAYRALEIQTANALLAVVDELAETDLMPLATNAWIDELKGLAFGQIGKLHLVNCDRDEPFSSFSSFFQKHGSEPCQFYFIAGHTAQKPSSFAERIIYEIVEAQQLQEDNSVVEYEREEVIMGDTKIGRVKFQPLPLGLNTESSQLKFKKYFSERMGQYGLASNLDTFFESKEKQLKYNYFALVFQLESERLNADVSRYLQWIMEHFRQTQDGQPRFLIFFVIHIPQANLLQSSDPLSEIRAIVNRAPDCCLMIEQLGLVSRDAIRAWFRNICTVTDESKIEAVINGFGQQLLQKQRWDGQSGFDMVDVESLLARVYLQWLKK